MITKEQSEQIATKFFNDPSWVIVEEMIMEYLKPLEGVANIDTKRTNDEIATDVKARQLVSESMVKFLRDCRILRKVGITNNTSFK